MTTPSTPCIRVHVDWTRCHGRGLCTELLPRLFGRDDWGYPIARDGAREPEVPASDLPESTKGGGLVPATCAFAARRLRMKTYRISRSRR